MTRMLTVAAVSAALTLTVHSSLPSEVAPGPSGFDRLASLQSGGEAREYNRDRDPLRGWDQDQRWDRRG